MYYVHEHTEVPAGHVGDNLHNKMKRLKQSAGRCWAYISDPVGWLGRGDNDVERVVKDGREKTWE